MSGEASLTHIDRLYADTLDFVIVVISFFPSSSSFDDNGHNIQANQTVSFKFSGLSVEKALVCRNVGLSLLVTRVRNVF